MIKQGLALILILVIASVGFAQVELNDPGGSLTSGGVDPVANGIFDISQGQSLDFEVSGNPNAPYILLQGSFANPGLTIGALGNQILNLNAAAVLGDGIGATSAINPSFFATNATGSSDWSFPVNPAMAGANIALQAITQDPAAPFNLNITAAAEFAVSGGHEHRSSRFDGER